MNTARHIYKKEIEEEHLEEYFSMIKMSELDRNIIQMLMEYNPTLQEMGNAFGLSRERIRQIIVRDIRKARNKKYRDEKNVAWNQYIYDCHGWRTAYAVFQVETEEGINELGHIRFKPIYHTPYILLQEIFIEEKYRGMGHGSNLICFMKERSSAHVKGDKYYCCLGPIDIYQEAVRSFLKKNDIYIGKKDIESTIDYLDMELL